MTCCVNGANTVPLDSLLRHVAPEVPQLPYSLALDRVRERYIEFARKSHLIVGFVELPIQREVTEYCLEAPEGYEVYSVKGVGDPNTWKWQGPSKDYWFSAWGHRFWVKDNSSLIFDREPSADESGRYVLLSLIPAACSDSIPVSVATPFGKAIAQGAVADALLMPGKAWSNPNLAERFELKFNRGVLAATNLALTNRGGHTLAMHPIRIL